MTNGIVDKKVLREDKFEVTQQTKEKRILIVEDNDYKFEDIVEMLNKYGQKNYVRKTTINSALCECIIEEQEVDIIILDMQFPRLIGDRILRDAGIQFIKKLKRECKYNNKKFPQIIGFTSEDFYKISPKELPREFIGQGSNIYIVEGIFKNIINL